MTDVHYAAENHPGNLLRPAGRTAAEGINISSGYMVVAVHRRDKEHKRKTISHTLSVLCNTNQTPYRVSGEACGSSSESAYRTRRTSDGKEHGDTRC